MVALHVLGFAIAGLLDLSTSLAEPIDRVVAVVDDRPIFLSELREQARPHLHRVDSAGGDAKQRAETMREVLEQMIVDRLEQREAAKAYVTASPADIDAGIQQVAKQAKLTPAELLTEAKRQGMSEAEYRASIGRQILEGKLLQLRVRGRVHVTDADARSVYATWVKEQTGPSAPIDLRIIVLEIANAAAKKQVEGLAAQIVAQARAGTHFCTLVTKYSQDPTTTRTCGSHGPLPRSALFPEIEKAGSALKPGEIGEPVSFGNPSGGHALLVIQRTPGSSAVPSFDSVKEQMTERAFGEAFERERKQWLQDLRKPAFIDVKL